MIKLQYLLVAMIFALTATSCMNEEEENQYASWLAKNQAYYQMKKDSVNTKGEKVYTEKTTLNNNGKYLCRVIKSGAVEGQSPYLTSTVKVLYKGRMLRNAEGYNLVIFDQTFDNNLLEEVPREFKVNGVIAGWRDALLHMKPGDKWELVFPYQLAYGASGNGNILPFSTLVFEVELLEITALNKP